MIQSLDAFTLLFSNVNYQGCTTIVHDKPALQHSGKVACKMCLHPCATAVSAYVPVIWGVCLQAEVQAGHQLLERWGTRNEAIARLEAVIEGVSGPVALQTSPAKGRQGMPCAAVTVQNMLVLPAKG